MSRCFIKFHFGDVGRVDVFVSAFQFFVNNESFQFAPDDGAMFGEKGKTFADKLGETNKSRFLPMTL